MHVGPHELHAGSLKFENFASYMNFELVPGSLAEGSRNLTLTPVTRHLLARTSPPLARTIFRSRPLAVRVSGGLL